MGKSKKINARKKNKGTDRLKINKNKLKDGADFIKFGKPLKAANNLPEEPEVQNKEYNTDYAILKDTVLQQEFLSVSLNNNQKGRLRQLLRDSLKGSTPEQLPDVINSRIQATLCNEVRTPAALRKIRLLFNMLKTAIENRDKSLKDNGAKKTSRKLEKGGDKKVSDGSKEDGDETKENGDETKEDEDDNEEDMKEDEEVVKDNEIVSDVKEEVMNEDGKGNKQEGLNKDSKDVKKKGPKRYVAFIGNLPLDVNKEMLASHFKDLSSSIKDIRIPAVKEDKKSAYAYLEMKDEQSYEMALSKNHSMLNNKRINVLYSTQQNSKITKSEAKGKAAKMVALQKTGKLLGSIAMNRKRSNRRKKQREALAKLQAEANK